MKDCTFSCILRLSFLFKSTTISCCEIFSMAFSIDLLLLAIIFAFSEKKPPLFSLSMVTSSEPVAIVLIVSDMVFFLVLTPSVSTLTDSPHWDRIVYLVFCTSWATLFTTDSNKWNKYRYSLFLVRACWWLSRESSAFSGSSLLWFSSCEALCLWISSVIYANK